MPVNLEATLPRQPDFRLFNDKRLIIPLMALLGLGLGALVAFNPKIGLGISLLPLLAVLILPNPKLGLYMFAAWLPFESVGSLSSDFTAVKLIGVFVFLAWFIKIARTREVSINARDRSALLFLLFLSVSILSITQARYPMVSIDRMLTMIQAAALYFMIIDLASDDRIFKKVLLVLVLAGVPAALIAISQFILGGMGRAVGVYPDPNYSALNILFLLPFTVALIDKHNGLKRRLFWGVFFILLAGMMVNLSRGGVVALVVIFFALSRNRYIEPALRKKLTILFMAVIAACVLLAIGDPRFSPAAMFNTGGSGRLDIWKTGWHIWLDHPLLGIGMQNYKFEYLRYAAHMPWIHVGNIHAMVAHNTYVETAVEVGAIGFLLFIGFISSTLMNLAKARQRYVAALKQEMAVDCSMLMISLYAFLAGSIFLSTMPKKALWVLLGLAASRYKPKNGG